jgi:hypothetical protein
MVFGHNSNVKFGAHTFHVQTEDRGTAHALIDTTVYYQGRVLHRRTNNYLDLLPLNEDSQQALKLRVDEQHRVVLEEIRSGELQLAIPPPPVAPSAKARQSAPQGYAEGLPAPVPAAEPRKLALELLNAGSWLVGKQATLQVAVQEDGGLPVSGVEVFAEIEGSAAPAVHGSKTGSTGHATITFEMPKLGGGDVALVIRVRHRDACAPLRYSLRAKPRVPAV